MRKLLLLGLFVCIANVMAANSALAGSGKFTVDTGIEILNQNDFSDENVDIRIWILTETDIQDPPTTKAEAEALMSFVQSPYAIVTYIRDPGTYYVVASNESHFESLGDDDPFEAGVDFSLLEVQVEEGMLKRINTFNTETDTLLPELQCE